MVKKKKEKKKSRKSFGESTAAKSVSTKLFFRKYLLELGQRPKEILFIDVILDYFLAIKNIMSPFRKNYLFQTNAAKDPKNIIM